MKFGSIQITKKRKEGKCEHCEKPLEIGGFYTTISIRARAKSGKHWFHNWHLHIQCLGIWLFAQLVARQDRRKAAGRPKGTGLRLSPEHKNKRLALLKARMRLFRRIALHDHHDKELQDLYSVFEALELELEKFGGPAKVNKRTTVILEDVERRLQYGRSLSGQAKAS